MNKFDPADIYGSILALPQQCRHAWEETRNFSVPQTYKNVHKIIMSGMGGSGLGARIIDSVYSRELAVPLILINDYNLPAWADEKTLVICSSFSGMTEETISIAKQAQAKHCCWMAISNGETLHELALQSGVPAYKINPTFNPSKQPRMALGYSIIGQLAMVAATGIISLSESIITDLVTAMKTQISKSEQAKRLAKKFFQKQVMFISSEHLTGAVHAVKNQMNENAKNLAHRYDLPELNHHLMEGLRFPQANKKDIIFFFVDSKIYSPRIRQRLQLTETVVKKNNIPTVLWQAQAKNKLTQVFELIQFGALADYYLAIFYQLNPAQVPWVDYFKTKLGQPLGQWK